MSDGTDNDPSTQQAIFDAYAKLTVENYCIIATSALLFFDCAISLSDEYHRVWRKRFSGTTAVYLVTRYGAVLERIVLLVSLFIRATEDSSCTPVLRLDDSLTDLNYAAMGAFTALRLFGIYGLTRKALVPFLAIAALWAGRVGIALVVFLQVSYTPVAIGPPLWGCAGDWFHPNAVFRSNVAGNALMLLSDALLLVLTWAKTYSIWRESTRIGLLSPVPTLLLRDGTTYFVLIFMVQVLAIISATIGSNFVLFDVWSYFAQVFNVIFLSHFILSLRGVYVQDHDEIGISTTINQEVSDVRFQVASRIVGNLGAPLDIASSSSSYSYYDYDDDEQDGMVEISKNPLMVGLTPKNESDIESHHPLP